MFVGQLIVGGVVSATVIVKLQLLLWPALSLARQVTLLVPNRKPVPEGGVQRIGNAPWQASVALAV